MKRHAFPNPAEFDSTPECVTYLLYLMEDQATNSYGNSGRYRHVLKRDEVDSILFVYDGCFIGEILIARWESPAEADVADFAPVQRVYLAKEPPRLFRNLEVRAADFDLWPLQYGKPVSDEVYAEILKRTGGFIN